VQSLQRLVWGLEGPVETKKASEKGYKILTRREEEPKIRVNKSRTLLGAKSFPWVSG